MKTPAPLELTAEGEQAWLRFRRHLDWAEGFALIFLFSDNTRLVETFRRRLEDILVFRTARLHCFGAESPDELLYQVLATVRGADTALPPGTSALWIEMLRQDGAGWEEGRRILLARLNEHRELLRRNIARPVVLVLPAGAGPWVQDMAPDLWSIRDFSIDLDDMETVRKMIPAPGREIDFQDRQAISTSSATGESLPEQVIEWRRLRERGASGPEALRAGWSATEAARDAGLTSVAADVAGEVLALARAINEDENRDDAATCLRDLSISLEKVGDTERELGRLGPAQAAYGESLLLMRRLHRQLGDSPQVLRDLSISLNKVGDTERQLGRLEPARAAYGESLALMRRLNQQLGDTPQVLRDLSISLEKVGDTERELGRLEPAQAAYGESLALMRRLNQQLGDTPQVLRDLSISLNQVGDTERELGRLQAAQAAYGESLLLMRRLHRQSGESPQVLRNLSISLSKVGDTERELGRLQPARAAYEESLALMRRLHRQLGDTPQVLRDLSISLANVGDTERELGRLQPAQAAYEESVVLRRRLHQQLGDSPKMLWDVATSLVRTGIIAEAQGRKKEAIAAFTEAEAIGRRFSAVHPGNPKYEKMAQDMAQSLERLVAPQGTV